MEAPDAKTVKVYAVVETTVALPIENLDEYLKSAKFTGAIITGYNQGGIRNVTTKEHIPLTMKALDKALEVMKIRT